MLFGTCGNLLMAPVKKLIFEVGEHCSHCGKGERQSNELCFYFAVTKETTYGTHGYDNNVPEMKPIFFARGPSFRKNVKVTKKFSNIDLYWLFCKILGLKPTTRIDGNNRMDIWNQMLVY